MSFIKDDDLQIVMEEHNNMIQIYVYDRCDKSRVRLGHVQGNQHLNSNNEWVSATADMFIAEKVRTMIHKVLKDIQDLT